MTIINPMKIFNSSKIILRHVIVENCVTIQDLLILAKTRERRVDFYIIPYTHTLLKHFMNLYSPLAICY